MLRPTTRSEAVPDWVRRRDANPHGTPKMGLLSKMHPLWPYTPLLPYPGCREPCFKITPYTHTTHCCMKKKPHLLDLGTISCMVVAEGGAKLPVIKKKTKSICFSLHQTGFNPKYFNLPLGFILPCAWQRGSDGTARLVLGCSPPPLHGNIVQGNRSFLELFDGQEEQRRLSLQAHGWAGIAGLRAGIHRWKGSRCAASPQV